ncbi:hypothetical protein XELAEV_18023522mg [Xenopus laevis]|uniref:Uncharacterized protein n=1 Tax=Xenopus laevis TaxID=8355 RepID=A0A974D6T3_XENLA|nr:hypothetical protein XELAEV_18023522mg [Xenopus laevis]
MSFFNDCNHASSPGIGCGEDSVEYEGMSVCGIGINCLPKKIKEHFKEKKESSDRPMCLFQLVWRRGAGDQVQEIKQLLNPPSAYLVCGDCLITLHK